MLGKLIDKRTLRVALVVVVGGFHGHRWEVSWVMGVICYVMLVSRVIIVMIVGLGMRWQWQCRYAIYLLTCLLACLLACLLTCLLAYLLAYSIFKRSYFPPVSTKASSILSMMASTFSSCNL